MRDLTLDDATRAIREISHDMTGRGRIRLASGREMCAGRPVPVRDPGRDFTSRNGLDPVSERVLEMWERALEAIETGNLDMIAREIDWVTKYELIERYRARHDLRCPRRGLPSWTWPTTMYGAAGACTTCCSGEGRWSGPPGTSTSSRQVGPAADHAGPAAR